MGEELRQNREKERNFHVCSLYHLLRDRVLKARNELSKSLETQENISASIPQALCLKYHI